MTTYLSALPSKTHYSKIIDIITSLLILLFVYTATSKLFDFRSFESQIHNQTFPGWISFILIWTLPAGELIVSAMLLSIKWRYIGLWISFILMLVFTGYIILVLANYFDRVPCSCGGVIKALGWKAHLLFNIFFLLLSLIGIFLLNRERRDIGNK